MCCGAKGGMSVASRPSRRREDASARQESVDDAGRGAFSSSIVANGQKEPSGANSKRLNFFLRKKLIAGSLHFALFRFTSLKAGAPPPPDCIVGSSKFQVQSSEGKERKGQQRRQGRDRRITQAYPKLSEAMLKAIQGYLKKNFYDIFGVFRFVQRKSARPAVVKSTSAFAKATADKMAGERTGALQNAGARFQCAGTIRPKGETRVVLFRLYTLIHTYFAYLRWRGRARFGFAVEG